MMIVCQSNLWYHTIEFAISQICDVKKWGTYRKLALLTITITITSSSAVWSGLWVYFRHVQKGVKTFLLSYALIDYGYRCRPSNIQPTKLTFLSTDSVDLLPQLILLSIDSVDHHGRKIGVTPYWMVLCDPWFTLDGRFTRHLWTNLYIGVGQRYLFKI